jgi:hypothetical protein
MVSSHITFTQFHRCSDDCTTNVIGGIHTDGKMSLETSHKTNVESQVLYVFTVQSHCPTPKVGVVYREYIYNRKGTPVGRVGGITSTLKTSSTS